MIRCSASSCQRGAILLALAGLLVACAAPRVVPPAPPAATVFEAQEDFYRRAQSMGQKVWPIDAQGSLIRITVHRDGTLARLGHDHVIASRNLHGFVAPEAGRADFYFRLDQLSVDEPALRAQAGFDSQPSAEAIDGTRLNMLTRALDARRFPFVFIHVTRRAPTAPATTAITLNGVTRTMDVALQTESKEKGITVNGTMSLKQSDFGIIPFAVLGGAIAVQDRLDLQFRIVAGR